MTNQADRPPSKGWLPIILRARSRSNATRREEATRLLRGAEASNLVSTPRVENGRGQNEASRKALRPAARVRSVFQVFRGLQSWGLDRQGGATHNPRGDAVPSSRQAEVTRAAKPENRSPLRSPRSDDPRSFLQPVARRALHSTTSPALCGRKRRCRRSPVANSQ